MGKTLDRAIIYTVIAHEGQLRKGTELPYILHPLEAASIAGTMTNDEEVIAAAVLHDVVEDSDAAIEDIIHLFGSRIGSLVAAESENKRANLPAADTWRLRKQETLDHLKTAPTEVKIITLADKLSNIRAIHRDFRTVGDALWQRFNQKDKAAHRWYYESIAAHLAELDGFPAYQEYCKLVQETFSM